MSAGWECQVAVYDALASNSTFMSLVSNRIYDEPPTNCTWPYVVIGDFTEIRNNRLDNAGYEVYCTLHIHDKPGSTGYKTCNEILSEMNESLNLKKLSMTNFDNIICLLDNVLTERIEDERIISARYKLQCW